MGKSRLTKGTCKLCGLEKELNKEHVPPKSAFNKDTRYSIFPVLDRLQSETPFEPLKGKIIQGGVTFQSFCIDCNNKLGRYYVNSYKDWAMVGGYLLNEGKEPIFQFDAKKLNLNRILKQVISMFIAINSVEFGQSNKELIDFVDNENVVNLDEKYRVFCYLTRGGAMRYIPLSVVGNLVTRKTTICTELSFPPFGYVLTIGYEGDLKGLLDITEFGSRDPNKLSNIKCQITEQKTELEIPLDYRSKEEIIAEMEKNKK